MKKSYIWSLPTRLFHWLLVLYIVVIYLTSESDRLLYIHSSFGYGVGILIVFRVLWGFIGPKYSKFSDFNFSIKDAVRYGLNILNPKQLFAGHNPAASIVMLSMMAVLFFVVVTGVLAYGVQEGRGILSFLNSYWFKHMKLFEEIHEAFTKLFVLLLFAHLGGVMLEKVLHDRYGVLSSMFTGYKNIEAKSVKLNFFQKLIAVVFLSLALVVPFYALKQDDSIFRKSKYETIDYETKNTSFVQECGSCHTLYPPFLLPQKSWKKLMQKDALLDHFGDDASLDEKTRVEIEKFLLDNSSETSTKESALYISKSIKNKDIISITKTPYWKKKHKNIDKKVWDHKKVRSKANCKACHDRVESGLIEDSMIKDIGGFR